MTVTSISIREIPPLNKGDVHQLIVLGETGADPVDVTLSCVLAVSDKALGSIDRAGKFTAAAGGVCGISAKYGKLAANASASIAAPVGEAPVADPETQQINKRLNYFEVALNHLGTVEADQLLLQFAVAHPFTLKANMVGSVAKCAVAGASETVISLRKNGTQFVALTFAAGETAGTFGACADTAFVRGDVLTAVVVSGDAETISATLYGEPAAK